MLYLTNVKGIIKRVRRSRIARNSLYNLIGFALSSILILVFTPLLVRAMGTEEYGLWIIAGSVLGIMGVFEMGFGTGITKYVAEYCAKRDREGLSSVVIGTLVFYLGIGVITTVPAYYLIHRLAFALRTSSVMLTDVSETVRNISFGFVPMLLMGVGLGIARGLQRYEISSIMSLTRTALVQATALVVVLLGGKVYHVVIGNVIALWIVASACLLIAIRMLRPYGLSFFFLGSTDIDYSLFPDTLWLQV